jgi:hypothetical protein
VLFPVGGIDCAKADSVRLVIPRMIPTIVAASENVSLRSAALLSTRASGFASMVVARRTNQRDRRESASSE